MNDMNICVIKGFLTRDAELKQSKDNKYYVKFSIANNYDYGKERSNKVNFFNCLAFGQLAEIIGKNFKKGHGILVSGRLSQESWQDETGKKHNNISIMVDSFNFINKKETEKEEIKREEPEIPF